MFTALLKRSIAIIESALKLIKEDLHKLSPDEKIKLARSIQQAVGGFSLPFLVIHEFSLDRPRQQVIKAFRQLDTDLNKCQEVVKTFFDGMMSAKRTQKDMEDEFRNWIPDEKFISPPLATSSVILDQQVYLEYHPSPSEGKYSAFTHPWPLEPEEKYRIVIQSRCRTGEEQFLSDFISALDGIPISSFRQCPECRNWFFHNSNKDKRFCSSLCRAKKGSRDSYRKLKEKDPEAYETKMVGNRKRAGESYRRKVEQEQGRSNVPIGKNARKGNKKEE